MSINEKLRDRFAGPGENLKCPYCLTAIKAKADVCTGCRRDVRRLLVAEARIQELESKLPPETPAAAETTNSVTTQIILVFYTLTTLTSWLEVSGYTRNASDYVAMGSAIITAMALTYSTPVCNLTYLFLVGFGQPAFVCLALLALKFAPVSSLPQLAPPALADGFQGGAAMALAGMFAAKLWLRKPVELGWSAIRDQRGEFDGFERVALRVAGVATPLVTLGFKLAPILFPGVFPAGKTP